MLAQMLLLQRQHSNNSLKKNIHIFISGYPVVTALPFLARLEPFITVVSTQDGDEVRLGAGAGGAPHVL